VANAACNGPVSRPLGILAASLGLFEESERFFEHAIDLDRRLGARPLLARAQCDHAKMLAARGAAGDREKALCLASQAQATAAELGRKLVAERALALRVEAQVCAERAAGRPFTPSRTPSRSGARTSEPTPPPTAP
jgi:hypothetical protein